ncbi:unnamed protein product [Phyllotreta striolata]|uniref:E3 ubiquitin-protein ligase n=1 Tax=Phyllotreta striolata TaxID=444603 RepID=A0A9N9TLT4_PHYSR|nr:unnamed protein product [Phyllotreta striolata]
MISKDHQVYLLLKPMSILKSQEKMADVQDELLQDLECPVCMEYLTPPIRMCTSGHSICDDCRSKITFCPLCAKKFSTGRNVTLEHVAEKIKYPCTYRKYGCKEKLSCNELYNHQRKCTYMEIVCFFSYLCQFKGSLQDQLSHCRCHDRYCLTMKDGQPRRIELLSVKGLCTISNPSYSFLIKLNDKYFWLRTRRFNVDKRIGMCVQMIGDRAESSKYKYEIAISNGDKRISFKDSCKPIYLKEADWNDSNTFSLNDRLYDFYSNNGFEADLTIEKTCDIVNWFSWYQFVIFLAIIIYVCQLNFNVDFGKLLAHSESAPKFSKNEYKHKFRKKYTHDFSNDTNTNFWVIIAIVFITITTIYNLINLIFETLRRIVTSLLGI